MRYTGLLVCAFHASGAELNLLPRKSSHFKAKERNHEANAPKVIDRDTGAPEQNITGDFHQCLTDKLDLDLDVDLVTVPSGNDKKKDLYDVARNTVITELVKVGACTTAVCQRKSDAQLLKLCQNFHDEHDWCSDCLSHGADTFTHAAPVHRHRAHGVHRHGAHRAHHQKNSHHRRHRHRHAHSSADSESALLQFSPRRDGEGEGEGMKTKAPWITATECNAMNRSARINTVVKLLELQGVLDNENEGAHWYSAADLQAMNHSSLFKLCTAQTGWTDFCSSCVVPNQWRTEEECAEMTMGETHDVVIEELSKLPDMEPQVLQQATFEQLQNFCEEASSAKTADRSSRMKAVMPLSSSGSLAFGNAELESKAEVPDASAANIRNSHA